MITTFFFCRLKSSERRRRTSSAGVELTLGGLRQAFLVAGEAVEAGLRGEVAEVGYRWLHATAHAGHVALSADLAMLGCSSMI
jgi:hypothetical protein